MTVRDIHGQEHCGRGCGEEAHTTGQTLLTHTIMVHGLDSMGVPAAPFLKTMFNGGISIELTHHMADLFKVAMKTNKLRNIPPAISIHGFVSKDFGSITSGFHDYTLPPTYEQEDFNEIVHLAQKGSYSTLSVRAAVRLCPESIPDLFIEYYPLQNRAVICPNQTKLRDDASFSLSVQNLIGGMRMARDNHSAFLNIVPRLKGLTVGEDGQLNIHAADMDLPMVELLRSNQSNCVEEAQKLFKSLLNSIRIMFYHGWVPLDLELDKVFRKATGHPGAQLYATICCSRIQRKEHEWVGDPNPLYGDRKMCDEWHTYGEWMRESIVCGALLLDLLLTVSNTKAGFLKNQKNVQVWYDYATLKKT